MTALNTFETHSSPSGPPHASGQGRTRRFVANRKTTNPHLCAAVGIVVASDRTSDSGSVKHGYPAARGFG